MSKFFPDPQKVTIAAGIDSMLFELEDSSGTQIMLSRIAPGAVVEPHEHPYIQMGMSLSGSFAMTINREEKIMEPLKEAYIVAPNTLHAAKNISNEYAIGLDLKFLNLKNSELAKPGDVAFLNLTKELTIKTGISMQFFVTRWCEIMVSSIPKGATMPTHKHSNEQIGIAVKGKYVMQVGDEENLFDYGKVYFSPGGTLHGAVNPFEEEALSLNIFTPPRYNRKAQEGLIKAAGSTLKRE